MTLQLHVLANCTKPFNSRPTCNALRYATAAERVPVFLGPLFVGSKIDDITTIQGT